MSKTLEYYDEHAKSLCEFYESHKPGLLYRLVARHFDSVSGSTLDIGCGSGRDAAYLNQRFKLHYALDASGEMLATAKSLHPEISNKFRQFNLLDEELPVREHSMDNILCSGLFMHFEDHELLPVVLKIKKVLKTGGTLIITFRDGAGSPRGENCDTRTFNEIFPIRIVTLLEALGFEVVEEAVDCDQAGRDFNWFYIVAKMLGASRLTGVERIQNVLNFDSTSSTYKVALLRAICRIALRDPTCITYTSKDAGVVLIPVQKIAEYFVRFYWKFIRIRQSSHKNGRLKIYPHIEMISEIFGGKCDEFLLAMENGSSVELRITRALKAIGKIIIQMPVRHLGGEKSPEFAFWISSNKKGDPERPGNEVLNAFIAVPAQVWRDALHLNYWIHAGVIMKWAELTVDNFGKDQHLSMSQILELLSEEFINDARSTKEVRSILESQNNLVSVWSGKSLRLKKFAVDHVMPFSVTGNNDLWNLLPASPKENGDKSNFIPSQRLMERSESRIVDYWRFYKARFPVRFDRQLRDALGVKDIDSQWEKKSIFGLIEMAERIANLNSLKRWDG